MFNVSDSDIDYIQPRIRPEYEEYYDDFHMDEFINITAYVTDDQTGIDDFCFNLFQNISTKVYTLLLKLLIFLRC